MFTFLAAAGLLAAVLGIWAVRPQPRAPHFLVLPDGSATHVLAVTYGTNHVLGPPLARWLARMPLLVRVVLGRILGPRAVASQSLTTPTPMLVVWLDRTTNIASQVSAGGYVEALLADVNGFVSGENVSLAGGSWSSPQPLPFHAFPRRDRTIRLSLFYHDPKGGVSRCGDLPFVNPLRGTFPNWQPEPLPATKRAGDVVVTLEKLSTGHGENTTYMAVEGGGNVVEFDTNRPDGRNSTVCLVHLKSLTDTNQEWHVANEELSDATGNQLQNTGMTWGGTEQGYIRFEPGLWTNETAWKLKCEIKRTRGFAPGETFAFVNVPLGGLERTNILFWTTNVAGVTVGLDRVVRRAPSTNSSWSSRDLSRASFSVSGLTNGLHLDLTEARTDTGTNLECVSWSSSGSTRDYSFREIPLEAKAVNFTFAVQRSRSAEFVVKPEVGAARYQRNPPDPNQASRH